MKKNTRRNQQGFTLIELLVVIAILAVLFGVTALALNGVGANAESAAAKGERDVVQTAIDVCDNTRPCGPIVVAGGGSPVVPSSTGPGAYLRRTTRFYYGWDATGKIITQTNASGESFNP